MPPRKKKKPASEFDLEVGPEQLEQETGDVMTGVPEAPEFDLDGLTPAEKREFFDANPEMDDSINKAKFNNDLAREWAASAELYRDEPEEYKGHRTKGYIRKFAAPFSLEEIRKWAKDFRGGGKYKVLCYDGGHVLRTRSTFSVEGNPMLQSEIEAAEHVAKKHDKEEDRESYSRERELERRLNEEKMDRMFSQFATMQREQNDRFERVLERLADKPKSNPAADWGPVLTALAPVLVEFVKKPAPTPPPDHFADVANLVEKLENDRQRSMNKMMDELKSSGKGSMENRVFELLLQNSLGNKNDPNKAIVKALDQTLPTIFSKLTQFAIDKGMQGDKEDDGEITPKYIAEQLMGVVKPLVDKGGIPGMEVPQQDPYAHLQQPPQMPMPQPMQQPMPMPHQMPMPQGPPAGSVPVGQMPPGTLSGDPFGGSTTLSQHGPSVPPPPASEPNLPEGSVAPQAPQPQAPMADQLPQHPDISAEVFIKAIEYMQVGKTGDELAHDVEEVNDGFPFISKRALGFLESMQPHFFVPHVLQAVPPQLAPHFHTPQGQQFILSFCNWFYDTDDSPDEEGDPEPEVVDATVVDVPPGIPQPGEVPPVFDPSQVTETPAPTEASDAQAAQPNPNP
jgi:hypothetical protein